MGGTFVRSIKWRGGDKKYMKNYVENFLNEYGFPYEATSYLLQAFDKIGEHVFLEIEAECDNTKNYDVTRFDEMIAELCARTGYHEYTVRILVVISLLRGLEKRHAEKGYASTVTKDTLRDVLYKYQECFSLYGIHGISSWEWYTCILSSKCFAIGRLEYEILGFRLQEYTDGKHIVKYDEPVLSVHIPSSKDSFADTYCQQSYTQAFQFFKKHFSDVFPQAIPFVCWSWLLYPKHTVILPETSNIVAFMRSYDIIEEEIYENNDVWAWRVFNVLHVDSVEKLPQRTSLQRAIVRHLLNGGKMGWGYGVFFRE